MDRLPPDSKDAARHFHLQSHQLRELMARTVQCDAPWAVDARPRIAQATAQYHPSRNLVDLEHERMQDALLERSAASKYTTAPIRAAHLHWSHPGQLWLTGLLPQYQRFRHDSQLRDDVVLLPDEDEARLLLHRADDGQRRGEKLYVCVQDSLCSPVPQAALTSATVSPWPGVCLMDELTALAQAQGLALQGCAQRYGTARLPRCRDGWWFHETLGFTGRT